MINVRTNGRSLIDITVQIADLADQSAVHAGAAHLFVQHTSASLIIQENADPDVCRDLIRYFDMIAPEGGDYLHNAEGPDDMPAHIKSALTTSALTIPISNGALMLGTWQGIYLFEHRRTPHQRQIVVTFSAEP